MGRECWPIHSKGNGDLDPFSYFPARLCRREGDHYVGAEIPLEGAKEIGQGPDDPNRYHVDSVPKAEDLGKRWRFRRNKWSSFYGLF